MCCADRAVSSPNTPPQQISALDAGAGTGILGMMAARAGCATVVGAELSAAMCDAAERTVARNGLASRRVFSSRSFSSVPLVSRAVLPQPPCRCTEKKIPGQLVLLSGTRRGLFRGS